MSATQRGTSACQSDPPASIARRTCVPVKRPRVLVRPARPDGGRDTDPASSPVHAVIFGGHKTHRAARNRSRTISRQRGPLPRFRGPDQRVVGAAGQHAGGSSPPFRRGEGLSMLYRLLLLSDADDDPALPHPQHRRMSTAAESKRATMASRRSGIDSESAHVGNGVACSQSRRTISAGSRTAIGSVTPSFDDAYLSFFFLPGPSCRFVQLPSPSLYSARLFPLSGRKHRRQWFSSPPHRLLG